MTILDNFGFFNCTLHTVYQYQYQDFERGFVVQHQQVNIILNTNLASPLTFSVKYAHSSPSSLMACNRYMPLSATEMLWSFSFVTVLVGDVYTSYLVGPSRSSNTVQFGPYHTNFGGDDAVTFTTHCRDFWPSYTTTSSFSNSKRTATQNVYLLQQGCYADTPRP